MITALGSRYGISGALGRSVKRAAAGAFSPTDITGCLCWLDFSDADTLFTDAGTTKVSADAQLIYRANDKSGNGNNAIQKTEARRYVYKTGIQNGLSIARNGTSFLLTGLTSTSGSYTFFYAINRTGGNWLFDAATGRLVLATNNSTKYSWNDGAWHDIAATTTGWQLLTYHFTSGGNGVIYKNGSSLGSAAYTATNIGGNVGLFADYGGGSNIMTGDAGEFLLYNSALSSADRQSVETYLNNKWAIYS